MSLQIMDAKALLSGLMVTLAVSTANAQSINPPTSDDLCPKAPMMFTVTLPGTGYFNLNPSGVITSGTASAIPLTTSGAMNIATINGSTSFNFTGYFDDVNAAQTFRVAYTLSNGSNSYFDFTYKKIRSFFHSDPVSRPQPTPSSVTVARCQPENFNIGFGNVQYANIWESPKLVYGNATQYEYLLPVGWMVNGTSSNGGSWISGANNAIITSDPMHGDGGSIQVRAINSCGSNLVKGPISYIPIYRPAPTLSISGANDICSTTSDYTVSGLPPGSTVCWTISSSAATIPGSPYCGNTVTVTRTSNGVARLKATVTDCMQTYPSIIKDITVGLPVPSITAQKVSATGEPTEYLFTATPFPGAKYNWYANGSYWPYDTSNTLQYYFPCRSTRTISCSITNACGTSFLGNSITKTGECLRTNVVR
ncbi:hypothetical protein F0U62_14985 [Cystobacter fuscus]|uniref:hypothetical protein n=1 Tax=Cystobacter fuscus TaxID=43 RepID=UPI002B29D25D|nr:hypothetical protein F0U62_14985 [Cystobacter fuscus]